MGLKVLPLENMTKEGLRAFFVCLYLHSDQTVESLKKVIDEDSNDPDRLIRLADLYEKLYVNIHLEFIMGTDDTLKERMNELWLIETELVARGIIPMEKIWSKSILNQLEIISKRNDVLDDI